VASTKTIQYFIDSAKSFGDIEPILNVGGWSPEPALTIANDVANAMLAESFPYKWNAFNLPFFYTNSWQQDYALVYPDGITSVTNLAWLQEGTAININSSSIPKATQPVEVGRTQAKNTSAVWSNNIFTTPLCTASFLPNYLLTYGTWGDPDVGTTTLGNNPQPNQVITNPLGQPSQPDNPCTQIIDFSGNFLLLTGYGTTGNAAPDATSNATIGMQVTDGTCTWTVLDPQGFGIRINPVPSQTGVVWQIGLVGQMTPPIFTTVNQTIAPIPDDYAPHFRAGFIAQCYRYSPESKVRAKFQDEWNMWLKSLRESRAKSDRERDEHSFIPQKVIGAGAGGGRGSYLGAAWPFAGPAPGR
jgi:hypothetical protein